MATGGPEALHQLCDAINRLGGSSVMLYSPEDSISKRHEYEKYNSPSILLSEIDVNDFLIFPEPWHRQVIPEFNSAIWWLAVPNDHFDASMASVDFHLCQSAFSADILSKHGKSGIMVSDYIDAIFENRQTDRKNKICSNPAKGFILSQSFISESNMQLNYLHGIPKETICDELNSSKIYIEFGHNPGKDRIPREAAACGNVVFMNRLGAGCYYDDYQIDEWFTFDKSEIKNLIEKVKLVFNDYDLYFSKQEDFRKAISAEKTIFDNQVSYMVSLIDSI